MFQFHNTTQIVLRDGTLNVTDINHDDVDSLTKLMLYDKYTANIKNNLNYTNLYNLR